mmetsp:Transcript_6339/g.18215  ORF Transcript_6339/g.18215 Transcript_6339/m.18215 type:complete len:220 (-) Transcript_6339:694-1353(-)
MARMVVTVKTGFLPRSVSAPSRKASAPSITALATSVASARVGRGLLPMVSTSRVMMTGLPRMLQLAIMAFWMSAIFSGTTSRPRLPRLMMMPSLAAAMPLKLNSDCRDSNLAKILVALRPMLLRYLRVDFTSSPLRTKDRLRKSISNSAAMAFTFVLSASASTGSSFWRLVRDETERSVWNTVSRPPSTASLPATHTTSVSVMLSTSMNRDDSSAPVTR